MNVSLFFGRCRYFFLFITACQNASKRFLFVFVFALSGHLFCAAGAAISRAPVGCAHSHAGVQTVGLEGAEGTVQ